MSRSQTGTHEVGYWSRDPNAPTVVTDTDEVDRVLGLLDDADCRAILETAGDGLWNATNLSETCDVPLSTMYRKLERLTEAGLLEDHLDIRGSGKHTREYARRIEDVSVTVGPDGGFTVTLVPRDADERAPPFRISEGW